MAQEKARILLVDDDTGFLNSMSLILRHEGYKVATAQNGMEAMAMSWDSPFDVVFLDIKMPVMDGAECYEKLKGIRPNAVVIIMTAYMAEDLIQRTLQQGAYRVMYKPFDMGEVLQLVAEIDDERCAR
jgi:DNA-binding NtrC family response regulator